jgi:hypothetical protein
MRAIKSEVAPRYLRDDLVLRERFRTLAEWWHIDTVDMASPSDKFQHPAYQRIIALGQPVIPFILEELAEHGGYWFEALRQIISESPVRLEDRNSYEAARRATLWRYSNKYMMRQHRDQLVPLALAALFVAAVMVALVWTY